MTAANTPIREGAVAAGVLALQTETALTQLDADAALPV